MIRLAESREELDFLPADPFSARITALFDTYGTGFDFALFWTQSIDGKKTAAVCRIDGAVTVYAGASADHEELSAFLNAVGYSDIICDEQTAGRLKLNISDSSWIVEFRSPAVSDTGVILRDYDKKEIYLLLTECGFDMGDFGAFAADVCTRLNKNTARLGAIENENGLAACAFALYLGEKSTLLGAVATKPSGRGNGYAGRLITRLALEGRGKVFLFCRNDSLGEFYKKYGFEICGRWAAVKQ